MYIVIDDRDIVAGGYATGFNREGVSKPLNFVNGSARSVTRT
jgi:hypothetical protein